MTSVIVFGKGNSILRSNKDYVETFDRKAIINFPYIHGYEKYISNKFDYHFCMTYGHLEYFFRNKNINQQDYDYYINNKLKISHIFNIGNHTKLTINNLLKDKNIKYDLSFRRTMMNKKKYSWFPPSGILVIDYFIDCGFKHISLVGYDFYCDINPNISIKKNKLIQSYYYLNSDNFNCAENCMDINTHHPEKQVEYFIKKVKQNPTIRFDIITNYKGLPELTNLHKIIL